MPILPRFFSGISFFFAFSLMTFLNHASAALVPSPDTGYEVIASGSDWQKLKLTSNELVAGMPGNVRVLPSSDELYVLQSVNGVRMAPLPLSVKQELEDDFAQFAFDGGAEVIVVHAGVVEAMQNGTIDQYSQYAEPDLIALSTNPFDKTSPPQLKGLFCKKRWHDRSKTASSGLNSLFNEIALSGDAEKIDGKFKIGLQANNDQKINARINYQVKKNGLCIPYKYRLKNVHVWGEMDVEDLALELKGTVSKTGLVKKSWELAKIKIMDTIVWVGPLPVRLGANIPIEAGLQVDVSATGTIGYQTHGRGYFRFDLRCVPRQGCAGDKQSDFDFDPFANDEITASIEANVDVQPYVDVNVQGFVYHEWLASVKAGLRAAVNGRFWGYLGNTCGDADGDGHNETVSALTLDAEARLNFIAAYTLIGKSSQITNTRILTRHIAFLDLLPNGSSAFDPLLRASDPLLAQGGAIRARMRPCVPFNDQVTYRVEFGDGSSENVTGAAKSYFNKSHNWPTTGDYFVTVTAEKDAKNRKFKHASTSRTFNVEAGSNTFVNIAPQALTRASSTYCSGSGLHCYSASRINDGSTNTTVGGYYSWANKSTSLPEWVELDWNAKKRIKYIKLFTSSGYEIRDYDIQYWTALGWNKIVSVTGNTQVERTHMLPYEITTSKIRVVGRKGPANQSVYVRVNELQVFGN